MIELRATKCHRISQVGLECAGSGSGEPEGSRQTVCFRTKVRGQRQAAEEGTRLPQTHSTQDALSLPLFPSIPQLHQRSGL